MGPNMKSKWNQDLKKESPDLILDAMKASAKNAQQKNQGEVSETAQKLGLGILNVARHQGPSSNALTIPDSLYPGLRLFVIFFWIFGRGTGSRGFEMTWRPFWIHFGSF